MGVLLALLTCVFALHRLRFSAFFSEVYYVWQVKQQQNFIYRKLKKIKAAAEVDDVNVNALIILNFYYASLKQVYLLDDNTLTMSKLNSDINELNARLEKLNLTLSTDQFEPSMLADF
jgi:Na+-transporting NADH:ubiquinone oxidoreductase subunit NqrC